MRDARICLVTLAVDDLARAAAFYEALGWSRADAGGEGVVFLRGEGIVLSLFGRSDLAADVGLAMDGSRPYPNVTLAINMPSERDVDRLYDSATAAGASAVKLPQPTFWGGYAGYFADLDGHLWEIAHNPFFRLTPAGHLDLDRAERGAA
ncbi:VOC family protein [Mangrovicella endophytica]|uniref:VOC family protein n=1 Tax=Mangrovicella endophytica TaxID=2066697 RepID=UPI000C9EC253|nr:VOC family protein [Mangrovicella endophytica]